jgi:hypothetical protein
VENNRWLKPVSSALFSNIPAQDINLKYSSVSSYIPGWCNRLEDTLLPLGSDILPNREVNLGIGGKTQGATMFSIQFNRALGIADRPSDFAKLLVVTRANGP